MGSSDKRRGTSASISSSHSGRAFGSSATASGTNTSSHASKSGGSSSNSGMVMISPPPRAALTGSSSASRSSSPAPSLAASIASREAPSISGTVGTTSTTGTTGSSGNSGAGSSSAIPPTLDPTTANATSQQLLQQGLRDRDDRIAHLERELAVMEAEFSRELDRLAAAEGETAAFWQARHSALHEAFLRADADLRLLRGERDALVLQVRERGGGADGGNNNSNSNSNSSTTNNNSTNSNGGDDGESTSSLRRQLRDTMARGQALVRERDDEIAALRSQVRGLKAWVSTSTRADAEAQTSDEVFGERMARLGNSLQNWVIVHFRKAKIDLLKASEDTLAELGRLVPAFEELIPTAKVHMLQSIVSRVLVEGIFTHYFIGLAPDDTQTLKQAEALLTGFASAESVNQWRSSTMAIIKKEGAQKLQPETTALIERLVGRINELLDSITDGALSDSRDQGLKSLLTSAVELARLLAVQKAVLQVTMPVILPHQRTVFDPSTMEEISGEDEESLTDREICCVTFPGIMKRGDEKGDHLQYQNVLCKTRVLCSPE